MATQIDLCNRALLRIGARAQVSSITPSDGSTEANACSVLFTPTFEELGRSAPWACLRKQTTLTLLAAAAGTPENPSGTSMAIPQEPWLYSYAYPSDCLRVRTLLPNYSASASIGIPLTSATSSLGIGIPDTGGYPFSIAYDTDSVGNPREIILSNIDQAYVIYTVNQQNPIIWDSQFQSAFCAALGAYLVPALSLSMPLMQLQMKVADELIMKARVTDGNEGKTSMDHTPDWIRARGMGATYNCNNFINAYQNMAWSGYY